MVFSWIARIWDGMNLSRLFGIRVTTKPVWRVSKEIMSQTATVLANRNSEVFVFWTASIETGGGTCVIKRLVVPEQDAHTDHDGAYVHIRGIELGRIDLDNFYRNERNVVQIHTHPSSDVRMSDLDRRWEVVKHPGALSIIVPNYARGGTGDISRANIYEHLEDGWRLWGPGEFGCRFKVT